MEATVTTHVQRQARKIDLSYDCKNDSGLVFLGSFWQLMESLKDEMKFNFKKTGPVIHSSYRVYHIARAVESYYNN